MAIDSSILVSVSFFVPGGQAGEESVHLTHEPEAQAQERSALRDIEKPKRPSLIKRILSKLRRG